MCLLEQKVQGLFRLNLPCNAPDYSVFLQPRPSNWNRFLVAMRNSMHFAVHFLLCWRNSFPLGYFLE